MRLLLNKDDDWEQFCLLDSESNSSTTAEDSNSVASAATLTAKNITSLANPPRHVLEVSLKKLSHIVKFSTHLSSIYLCAEGLLHCVVSTVCEALIHSTAQQRIQVDFHFMNRATYECLLPVANLMKNCKRVIEVEIKWGEIREDGVSDLLADALRHLSGAVTQLKIEDSILGDDEACAFAENLKFNTTLTILDLTDTEMSDKGTEALADALKHNGALTELDLSYNSIGKKGGVAIGHALLCNRTLEILNLGENAICDEGAMALAAGLRGGSSLKKLHVDDARIGKKGGVALGEALAFCSMLETLDIRGNLIGDEGAAAIASSLVRNATLKALNLHRTGMRREGASALASSLASNASLAVFDISLNEIGDEGVAALAIALRDNVSLNHLNLDNCQIGDVGAIALAEAIACNVTLDYLYLPNNRDITEEIGVKALVHGLNRNSTLMGFYLGTCTDTAGIGFALRRNRTLLEEAAWMKHFSDQDIQLKGKVLSKAMERYSTSEFSELTFLFLKSQVSTIAETVALSHPAGAE